MSFHVFVSLPGFKDQPIPEEAWLAAVRGNSSLLLSDRVNRLGDKHHVVKLESTGERLSRTPYGLVDAQDPSEELIRVMFQLADALGAGVYSERLTRYQSVADWEQRTRKYRERRAAQINVLLTRKRRRMLFFAAVLAISAVVGWYLGSETRPNTSLERTRGE